MDEQNQGKQEELLVAPEWTVARNEQAAALKIAVKHNTVIGDDPQVSILVRNF